MRIMRPTHGLVREGPGGAASGVAVFKVRACWWGFSLGPRLFLGEEKRPGAICSRMRGKLRKITVKSLVYMEMKYTAEVYIWYKITITRIH